MKKLNVIRQSMVILIFSLFAIMGISDSCSQSSNGMYGMGGGGGGGNGGGSGGPGANQVWMQGYAFNPSSITVTAGTTITWTNKDPVSHTVTSDNSLFNSGSIGPNGTFSYTFSTAGTYPYHCSIHTYMIASVKAN